MQSPEPGRRLPAAFTLIEVMVALVIFALTAVVLGSAYVNVLNSYEIARKANVANQALWLAHGQLLQQADLTTAQNGMEFDDDDPSLSGVRRHVKWTAEITPADTTDLFTVILTCIVSESSPPNAAKYTETFMLVRPTWSDPTARSTLRQNAASRIAIAQGRQPAT
jgi:prepilin-type N-terminal cleavage/methylation domain-containing protein